MTNWHRLNPGDVINNDVLSEIFKCSTQGGMRRALKTNSLIIVSNHVESLYDDRWINDVLHYTGTGRRGDQSITHTQNKTLNESNNNGVEVYLFEVFKDKEYTFRGRVQLAGDPYQENQPDDDGKIRKVWVFPVTLIGTGKNFKPSEDTIRFAHEVHEKKARRMSFNDLEKRAKNARKTSSKRNGNVTTYDRDPYVAEFAKRRAEGICQLCENPAPFHNKHGEPYLETHHVEWLARGGEDSTGNTVALCPNCHKKMHILDLVNDVEKLKKKALEEISYETH
ncbi:HNH endonuclease [Brevibacillus sp. HB1.4B]|uniref:HNH endonuclease n=1 Tax=unclassified Brevibacillus TaxID=2684853 RepID=UPI0006F7009B|nr:MULTISPECIES: HNH endonuclease [unclassified Brevibacillus]NRS15796.1 HNH endonuclease [Brevibacillus sp. HB1.4B]RAT94514.1 restriction endonuclease [Brevibacillus sp. Leaf182]